MSSLTENLSTIYGIKNQIKEAIGTSSDIFADYPAYISAMAGGITPTGYAYVTSNGDYDVSTYAMVNVEVSGGEIPPGYTYVSGTYNITTNGTGIDIASYASVDVAVPIPAGYIVPAGTLNVSANGSSIDVASYAYANVAVPIPAGYIQPSGTITIDDNYNNTTVDVTSYAYADVQISGGGSSSEPVILHNINYITTDDTSGSVYKVLYDGMKMNYDPEYGTPFPVSYISSETITDKFDANNPANNDSYIALDIYEYESGIGAGQLLYAYTAVYTYTFLTNGNAGTGISGSIIAAPDSNEQSAWSFDGIAATPEYTMIYFDNNTLQSDTEVCFYSYAFIYNEPNWIIDENAPSGDVYDTNSALCVATIPANTNWILIKWSAEYTNTIEKIMKNADGWGLQQGTEPAGIWEELETMQPGGGGY